MVDIQCYPRNTTLGDSLDWSHIHYWPLESFGQTAIKQEVMKMVWQLRVQVVRVAQVGKVAKVEKVAQVMMAEQDYNFPE
jgi:hypothetical protein